MDPRFLPSMVKEQRIAVFDVCGTITRTNNTFAFIGFVLKTDHVFRYCLLMLVRVLSPFFNAIKIEQVLGRDVLRSWQIRLLRGFPADRIEEMSHRYVEHLFDEELLNQEVLEAMKQETKQGRTILLVSSSIDPPITALARKLGIERCFASELEVENGCYTGRLRTDLTGNKQSVLGGMSKDVDLENSSVYSDNAKDFEFMRRFGKRYVVVNDPEMGGRWSGIGPKGDLVVNYDKTKSRDTASVNAGTVKWVYVPALYYAISRLHGKGVLSLFLREIVPYTLAGYWLTNLGPVAFAMIPLSLLMFYSVYEIGGLVNDLLAGREEAGERTNRIAPGTRINLWAFIAIRLAFVVCMLMLLRLGARVAVPYAGMLLFCLAVCLVHSVILSHLRVVTFVLLKICRNVIPWIILADYASLIDLAYLCLIFFSIDAPLRVYWYCHRRGLVKGTISVWCIRPLTELILCGLGAVVYLVESSPSLVAIALYYLVLDSFWGVLRRRRQSGPPLLRQMQ